ncbi:MAG: hypothetical protein IJO59_07080 [Clostridia bacterium]|nr:hypothetical protein [Clostridia bacterium]
MVHKLYGDGVHDDTAAIQELIDSGRPEVILPVPDKHYVISKPLELPSNFRLVLPRYAEIRLADGSNCLMAKNKWVADYDPDRLPKDLDDLWGGVCKHLWYYVNEYSPDAITENIEICGGIWNCNNLNQLPNPERTEDFGPYGYTGEGMLFYGVKNLKLSSLTLKDPVHWGISFDRVSYFTVEDITFDYNLGNPFALNMDGVHINGNCHYGVVRNLKGATYDDMVALNAHEGSRGPITNILIDGLFAETCHSAVRLLTVADDMRNIHITNVYGTYYQYCIGITKYYPGETTGVFDAITLDHIYASKACGEGIHPYWKGYVYPFVYIQEETKVTNLKIADVRRDEYNIPIDTIWIGKGAVVENLILDNVVTENHTGEEMPFFTNLGEVHRLTATNLVQDGTVHTL